MHERLTTTVPDRLEIVKIDIDRAKHQWPKLTSANDKIRLSALNQTIREITKQQPEILHAMHSLCMDPQAPRISNPQQFILGVCLAFELIPTAHKNVPLDQGHITHAAQTILDSAPSNQDILADSIRIIIDKLKVDSPELIPLINKWTKQSDDSFLTGVAIVISPFLLRAEAVKLEKQLDNFGK